jgi:phosphatidylglycerol:prolipoprotein diacylglycerol transferase
MQEYPPNQLFHATFLYESIWNIAGLGLILWLERRLKGWLRTGDSALMYLIVYGVGRLWIEGLRTDSLCTSGVGGDCAGGLRTAQVVSMLLIVGGLIGMYINHRRTLRPAEAGAPAATEAEASSTTAAVTLEPPAATDAPRTDEPVGEASG